MSIDIRWLDGVLQVRQLSERIGGPGHGPWRDVRTEKAESTPTVAEQRLAWLHSRESNDVNGYEWGIYRVKWENGKAVEVWQTASDFSDLDAARAALAQHQAPQQGEQR